MKNTNNDQINKSVHQAMGGHWHSYLFWTGGNRCPTCTPDTTIPDYCNDLNLAFSFAEKVIEDGRWELTVGSDFSDYGRWYAGFERWHPDKERDYIDDQGDNVAKSICIAGLKALGRE